jgi:hypothetical protein
MLSFFLRAGSTIGECSPERLFPCPSNGNKLRITLRPKCNICLVNKRLLLLVLTNTSLAYAREARGEYFPMKLTRSRSQYLPCEKLIDQGGPPRCVCSAMAALANPCDQGKTPFLTVSVSLRAGSTDGESNVQKDLLQRFTVMMESQSRNGTTGP